jgi:hypothetical protein
MNDAAERERIWTDVILKGEGIRRFLPPAFPSIVCLCGSTRFAEAFRKANYEETMAGRIVLSVGFYPHSSEIHGEGVGCTADQKAALDELHKRKVELADEVLILNVGGYIGSSTRGELEHAREMGKVVRFLEPPGTEVLKRSTTKGTP